MRSWMRVFLILLAVPLLGAVAPDRAADKFRLKQGAAGKLCLECHTTFQDTMKLPFVHTPVKSGECIKCHNPHASNHGKLLSATAGAICATCHASLVPKMARSVHAPVASGDCIKCHDPHGATNQNNLHQAGNALCLSCHKEKAAALAQNKFKHAPVEKNCLGCHDPHASAGAEFLLKKEVPALCTGCHRPDQPVFAKQHMNYPVARGRCTSCHDPHGSSNNGILWATVHPPVANKMCNQCHLDPSSPDALAPKKAGFELCRGCHNEMTNEILSRSRVHWPVLDRTGCLNCHNPHASPQKALLAKPTKSLCRSCHADTLERQDKSLSKHPPAEEGECVTCHSPHASDQVFLFQARNVLTLCTTCHDYGKHSSHPIGEKAIDPRNRNLTVDCESCHRVHGSPFKSFTTADPGADLCTQCHQEMKR